MEKQCQGVVQLMDALTDVGDGGHDAPVVGGALYHSGFVDHGGFLHQFHGLHLILPDLGGAFGQGQLLLHQHQGIVDIGHGRDDLRACGGLVFLHLLQRDPRAALAVQDLAEHVDLPLDGHRDCVGPGVHLSAAVLGGTAVRRQGHGGEVAELGALQLSLGDPDVLDGVVDVGVLRQCAADVVLEQRVGEDLLPAQAGQGGGIHLLGHRLGILVDIRVLDGHLVFLVDAAACHQQ